MKDHVDLRIKCRDVACNKEFGTLDRERSHFYTVHMDMRCGLETCPNRNLKYKKWKKLKEHFRAKHGPNWDEETRHPTAKDPPLKKSSKRSFSAIATGQSSQKEQKDTDLYKCPYCRVSRTFAYLHNLRVHLRKCHANMPMLSGNEMLVQK